MFGWLRAAAACASARKRRRKPSSPARPAWSTFTATRRRNRVSSARKTWAEAPAPIGATRRYRSERTLPIWSAIATSSTVTRVRMGVGDAALGRLAAVQAEIADVLEGFVEDGTLWDEVALAAIVARL